MDSVKRTQSGAIYAIPVGANRIGQHKWRSFKDNRDGAQRITAATILKRAMDNGWMPAEEFERNAFGQGRRFIAYFGDRFRYQDARSD